MQCFSSVLLFELEEVLCNVQGLTLWNATSDINRHSKRDHEMAFEPWL